MKKKLLTLFLCITLPFMFLTGCGNSSDENAIAPENTGAEAAGGSEGSSAVSGTTANATILNGATAEDRESWWDSFEEPVTITTVGYEASSAVYPAGDGLTNNIWIRAYKDLFNITLTYNWASTDEETKETKLNLDISGGNLPDVFNVKPYQLQQLIEADLIWDLTEIYDTYASERTKINMEADQESFESGMSDGKLYGLANLHWGIIEQPDYIWIRNDWKEALALEDPDTMDDLVNIMLAFMEAYGTYGLSAEKNLDYLNLIAIAWQAYPDMWITGDDGSIVYGSVQDEMKDALAAWADWYQQGIINPNFSTATFEDMSTDAITGKVGVMPFYQWWGYSPGVDVVSNQGVDAIFYPYRIPSATGGQVYQSILFANQTYTVVSKTCKNPEAVLKMINLYGYLVDDAMGIEDDEIITSFTNPEIVHVVPQLRVLNPNCDYDQFIQVSNAVATGDTSGLINSGMWGKYESSMEFINNGTPAVLGDYSQQGSIKPAYGLAADILDNELYIKSRLWGGSPEALLSYGSTLDDILTEGYTKIIMGLKDIDYFDTVVSEWYAAGGEKVTQEMNEMYGE